MRSCCAIANRTMAESMAMFAWQGEVRGDRGLAMYLVHCFIDKLSKRLADNFASKCCTRFFFQIVEPRRFGDFTGDVPEISPHAKQRSSTTETSRKTSQPTQKRLPGSTNRRSRGRPELVGEIAVVGIAVELHRSRE